MCSVSYSMRWYALDSVVFFVWSPTCRYPHQISPQVRKTRLFTKASPSKTERSNHDALCAGSWDQRCRSSCSPLCRPTSDSWHSWICFAAQKELLNRYLGDSLRDLRWGGECWPWDRNLNLPISHWHPEIKGYCTLW